MPDKHTNNRTWYNSLLNCRTRKGTAGSNPALTAVFSSTRMEITQNFIRFCAIFSKYTHVQIVFAPIVHSALEYETDGTSHQTAERFC